MRQLNLPPLIWNVSHLKTFPLELLGPAIGFSADPSSSKRKILRWDTFQISGGKHNCPLYLWYKQKRGHNLFWSQCCCCCCLHSHSCFELSTERQPKPAIKYPHTASACCYSWASPASVGRQSIWQPRHTITERTGYIQNVDHFFQSPQSTRCSNRWIKQLLCLPKTRKSIHDYFILLLGILTRSDKQILFLHVQTRNFNFIRQTNPACVQSFFCRHA